MKLQVRILNQEEKIKQADTIVNFCFHVRGENVEKRRINWCDDESEMWGAFLDNNILTSVIYNNHFNCMYNNKIIKMTGVGGVSTLPEYRGIGGIKEIFKELLNYNYQNGDVISCLSPFSAEFYRKFGYDITPYRNEYIFKPAFIKEYQFDGEVIRYQDNMSYQPFIDLYNEYIKNYNLSVIRTNDSFNYRIPRCNLKTREFAYLFKKDNSYISYIVFNDIFEKEAACFKIKEIIYINRDGFNAVMNFLSRFTSDYGKIILPLPLDIDLNTIIHTPNCYAIEKETRIDYMVRVINVFKILEIIAENNNTCFKIKVNDNIIKENNHTYYLNNNHVSITEEEPDVECDITTFSQMVFGNINLQEVLLKDDVIVYTDINKIKNLLNQKSIYITEYF